MKKLDLIFTLILSLLFSTSYSQVFLEYKSFTVYYDTVNSRPIITYYQLIDTNLINKYNRTFFKFDTNFNKKYQTNKKYSGYDYGHLVPNDDMCFDSISQLESMFYTNQCPQNSKMNRGVWKGIENYGRLIAKYNHKLLIFTGVFFLKTNKQNQIPDYFFKIFIYNGKYECYVIENKEPKSNNIISYKIDKVKFESLMKKTNFPKLPFSIF